MLKLFFWNFLLLNLYVGIKAGEEVLNQEAVVDNTVLFAPEVPEMLLGDEFESRSEGKVGQLLTNVKRIVWAPGGLRYWVIFQDHTAQIYLPVTTKVGQVLSNVRQIIWSSDGMHAWIIFQDSTARLYGPQGFFGEILTNVRFIRWGSGAASGTYWVIFNDHTARCYNMSQGAIGELLTNVRYLYWSPNGTQYLVLLQDHTAQMYNL